MAISRWHHPVWRVFDADPALGKTVRDWIGSVVGAHPGAADQDDAALVSAELFANAVMHGPPQSPVLVSCVLERGAARIVVCDGGGATAPRLRQSPGLDEGGRGLWVVNALSVQWGSFRIGQARVVWCDLGQPLPDGICDPWGWLDTLLTSCPVNGARFVAPAGRAPAWCLP